MQTNWDINIYRERSLCLVIAEEWLTHIEGAGGGGYCGGRERERT
jgi:hypothetical protein